MTSTDQKPTSGQSLRLASRKRLLWIGGVAGTVVLMGAIMFGVWALTAQPESRDTQITAIDSEEESRLLFEQALAALESDDASAAVALLERAVTLNPLNMAARSRLELISGGGSSSGEGEDANDSGGSTSDEGSDSGEAPTDPDEGFLDPISDLILLLPASVEGYDMGAPLATQADAQITAEAQRSGSAAEIRISTFHVHDLGDKATAEAFVANQIQTAFSENSADVMVNGVDAYFGTDGANLAVVSLSRGRFAMEVIVAVQPGVSPGAVLDLVVEAAEAFPTSL